MLIWIFLNFGSPQEIWERAKHKAKNVHEERGRNCGNEGEHHSRHHFTGVPVLLRYRQRAKRVHVSY